MTEQAFGRMAKKKRAPGIAEIEVSSAGFIPEMRALAAPRKDRLASDRAERTDRRVYAGRKNFDSLLI